MIIQNRVIHFANQHRLFKGGCNVVVALSGGADSVALLDFCQRYKTELGIGEVVAAHFNHRLRAEESDNDQSFCERYCGEKNIRLFTEEADVAAFAASSGQSVEMAARQLRYDFLRRIAAQQTAVIATAHHAQDNAETLFLNLIRGTGLAGLGGMVPNKNGIIRPFLNCEKADLLEYCRQNGLDYVTDSSNASDVYARNALRLHVFPELLRMNPSLHATLRREMDYFREDEQFLSALADEALQKARREDEYNVPLLAKLAPSVLSRVVMKMFAEQGVTAYSTDIDRVLRLIANGSGHACLHGLDVGICKGKLFVCRHPVDKNIELPQQKLSLGENRYKDCIIIVRKCKEAEKNAKSPFISSLNYDKIMGNVTVRGRKVGDRISLVGSNGSKSLKKLFNEKGIPVAKRDGILVFCDDNGVIAVEGIGIDKRVYPDFDGEILQLFVERTEKN